MRGRKVLIMTVAILAIYMAKSMCNSFNDNRLFAPVKIGNETRRILIDTGAAYSAINAEWAMSAGFQAEGVQKVNATTGALEYSKGNIPEISFSGQNFQEAKVLLSKSKKSLLGANIIFRSLPLLLSKEGVNYGAEKPHGCMNIPVKVDLLSASADGDIAAIYLGIIINGREEYALLDTGSPSLLLQNNASGLTIIPEIISNTDNSIKVVSFKYVKALVRFGEDERVITYRAYRQKLNPRADYILGSPILNFFSLYLNPKHGEACFVRRASDK